MLNKLSFNLMNELNESETESCKIKKKVIMESDRVICEDHQLYYDDIQNMSTEERHELWMTYHDKDFEDTDEGNDMFWDWAEEEFPVKELNDSEEPTHQVLNEDNNSVIDKIIHGDDVYFRDSYGQAIMIHYAENYPQPEDYDEGYKDDPEGLEIAKKYAESGDVFEALEIDEDTLEPTGTTLGYFYGPEELTDGIAAEGLREVKIKKSLEEDMIDDNIEAARQDSIEKGLTSESEEADLDEPNEDDNKNILQAKKDELEARLGEILMSIKDKQMDTDEFRALSREAAEIDSQITDLENQINGLYESEIDNIIADKGILPEIKKFDDKIIRDAFLNMCELQQISVENQTQVLQECRRLSGEEPLTESGEEPNEEVKKECDKPITEANVSGKTLLKNQGNIYMFECKGNKDFTHIVGENYNESENLLENVETYTSKEEADKDYLKRCGLK